MTFVDASFLLGAAAVAVPIAIHFAGRKKAPRLRFPTLRFLREVERRTARRRRLEQLLLLLLRSAAIVLLALGLAKPLLYRNGAAASGAAATAAIVLDDSLSMRAFEGGAERFERAREAALEALRALGPGDSAALVLPNGGILGPTSDLAAVGRALELARPSFGARPLALDAARKILEAARTPTRVLVAISDLQRGSFGSDRAGGDFEAFVVPVGSATPRNATVLSVESLSPASSAGAAIRVRATLLNRSDREEQRTLSFVLDGRAVEERRVTIPAGRRLGSTAEFDLGAAGWHEVSARLDPDSLAGDDEARLVLDARDRLRVLLVGAVGAGYADESFYLLRALDPSGRAIDATACAPDQARRFKLGEFALVVSFGDPQASLLEHVARGGSLLVVGGAEVLEHGAAGALSIGEVESRHPVIARLAQGEPPADLGTARFYRTFRLEAAQGDQVLARFSDGSPALVERRRGGGRIVWFASALTPAATNFPLKPGFVPFVRSLAAYLAAGGAEDRMRVGASLALAYPGAAPLAVSLDGIEKEVVSGRVSFEPFTEPGFARIQEFFADGARERWVAVDVEPAEGDLDRADPVELARLFDRGRIVLPDALRAAIERARRGIELSWAFLFSALATVLAEGWFSNRVALGAREVARRPAPAAPAGTREAPAEARAEA